jgi:hypothetical protein
MAMLLYRRQRKTWEDSFRQISKEKRSKSLKNALAVRQQNSQDKEVSGASSGRSKKPSSAHGAKKQKTKSSMFDNCS